MIYLTVYMRLTTSGDLVPFHIVLIPISHPAEYPFTESGRGICYRTSLVVSPGDKPCTITIYNDKCICIR